MTRPAPRPDAVVSGHCLVNLRIDVQRQLTPGYSHPLQAWTATFRALHLSRGQAVTLGTADLWIGNAYEADLVDAADEMHGDLLTVVEAVVADLDSVDGDRRDGLLDDVVGGTILVVNEVRLEARWRGFGLGPLLLAEVIESLRAGVDVVACYPMPLPDRKEVLRARLHADETARRKGQAALQRTWRRTGFEPLVNDPEVFALSFSSNSFDEHLQVLRDQHRELLDSCLE